MREASCDVLICGGGVGGCAAAMAACSLGMTVILTEENLWIGGQLTSQAVPPDEHPWIESFGCTARYRDFRNRVRAYYRDNLPLTDEARANPLLNPGGGWVSRLCHEPAIAVEVLQGMLAPHVASGKLILLSHSKPVSAEVLGDQISSVDVSDLRSGEVTRVTAKCFLDATELGELMKLTGTEYVTGAESQRQTGERHAVTGEPMPQAIQGITHVIALAWDSKEKHVIDKPASYEKWRAYKPEFWPGPILGFTVTKVYDGEPGELPLVNPENHQYELLTYRQCVNPNIFTSGERTELVTLVNWPQNDYYVKSITDVSPEEEGEALQEARDLSWSLVYWLQTEAPRHDGGVGYPEMYLRSDIMGTADGFAQYPYIRESRRLKAKFTILEQHVSEKDNPGRDRAQPFADTVGVGAYRIDLHPSTSGQDTIDIGSVPFQIPLGAMIPQRMRNLLPACKNIGTTHITNGCYRLHPVEWNIAEAAGALAAFCIGRGVEPHEVHEKAELLADYQRLLVDQGFELAWPAGVQLKAL